MLRELLRRRDPSLVTTALFARSDVIHVDKLPTDVVQESEDMIPGLPKFNFDTPTLGGRQFWGDVVFFQGYRIQHNVLTNHFRLLDPGDVRRAWGAREDCQSALDRIRTELQLPPMTGKAVILIHGIFRSSKSLETISNRLKEEGYLVVGFDYPSTRHALVDSARYLASVIESLQGVEQIDVVVHSMGGLLLRTYVRESQTHPDPRLHRVVMLGVPNQGARMANLLQNNWLFRVAYGPAGQQLVEDPEGFIATLPVPNAEFAVIAGVRGTPDGWNPLIPGDDDGTVSVEATKLPGAADFIEIPSLHSLMVWNANVIDATVRFLKTGALRESGIRVPIPVSDSDDSSSPDADNVTPPKK
ncbi:esterase/lipase family protein [Planctomicrobium sp. SH661]|uniref:esterase/lipase family protein n=1 Tax=Planctomicrobium sp. SH661 TaxID=3448124 RepID=UPI003F5B47C5